MKSIIVTSVICLIISACSRVTTKPDTSTTTSGTLGSVKATDQPARNPVDTIIAPPDTLKTAKDSTP